MVEVISGTTSQIIMIRKIIFVLDNPIFKEDYRLPI